MLVQQPNGEAAWVGRGSRNVEEEEEAAGAGTRLRRRRRARELFISSDDTQMAVLRVSSILGTVKVF
jgi:hypothetical protein